MNLTTISGDDIKLIDTKKKNIYLYPLYAFAGMFVATTLAQKLKFP